MQGKELNNWKQKLEDEAFAAQMLGDKGATWKKLHSRLHKKTAPRFLHWRWQAAACLLAAVIFTIIFLIPEKEQASAISISPNVIDDTATKNNSIAREEKSMAIPLHKKPQNKNAALTSTQKNNATVEDAPMVNNQPAAANTIAEQKTSTPFTPADAAKTLTAEAPVKKKLRVVHINDLGQPNEESTADNKYERPHFQLKIINGEYYHPTSTSGASSGLMLFQSKNVSN